MSRIQEIRHKTSKGTVLNLMLEELRFPTRTAFRIEGTLSGEFGSSSYTHPAGPNDLLADQYRAVLSAWIRRLEQQDDKIDWVDNPSNCELLSLNEQQTIRTALEGNYEIKVNGAST